VAFRLVARTGNPDFLDLPWEQPLEEWKTPRFVHFVDYDGRSRPDEKRALLDA
jgi:hypothetical protein